LQLRAAFPAVEQLRLELNFEGATAIVPAAQSHVLHPPARAFFEFPCPYADCDGQFDLTSAVSAVLANEAVRAEGVIRCLGHRPDPHTSRAPCQLQLNYVLTATYQQAD